MRSLALARNLFGPLDTEYRRKIEAYLDHPTEVGWGRINGIVLRVEPVVTVWQAVIRLDPTMAEIGLPYSHGERPRWRRWPDAMLVARAIRMVVEAS